MCLMRFSISTQKYSSHYDYVAQERFLNLKESVSSLTVEIFKHESVEHGVGPEWWNINKIN